MSSAISGVLGFMLIGMAYVVPSVTISHRTSLRLPVQSRSFWHLAGTGERLPLKLPRPLFDVQLISCLPDGHLLPKLQKVRILSHLQAPGCYLILTRTFFMDAEIIGGWNCSLGLSSQSTRRPRFRQQHGTSTHKISQHLLASDVLMPCVHRSLSSIHLPCLPHVLDRALSYR